MRQQRTPKARLTAVFVFACVLSLSFWMGGRTASAASNEPPVITADSDHSIQLDGTSGAITASAVPIPGVFTVEVWAKSGTTTWNDDGFLVSGRAINGFILHPVKGTRQVDVYIVNIQGDTFQVDASFFPADITQWHHYAVSFNGSSADLYLDGAKVGSGFNRAGRYAAAYPVDISVGVDTVNTGSRFGNVAVDEVRVWNYGRSALDIAKNMSRKLNGNESGLVLYWNFDPITAGSPPTVKNIAIAGGVGTIQGGYTVGTRVAAVQTAVYENDGPVVLPGLSVADGDAAAGGGSYVFHLSVAKGSMAVGAPEGLSSISGNGSNDVTGTGTLASLNASLQAMVYKPNMDDFGPDALNVSVTDSGSADDPTPAIGTFALPIDIVHINQAPSFHKGTDIMVPDGAERQVIAGWATDMSAGPNESQQLSFQASSNNPGLFLEQPALDDSGTLTFQPKVDVGGKATVTVTLKDDGGTALGGSNTATVTFTIEVVKRNSAPTFSGNRALHFNGVDNGVKVSGVTLGVNFTAELWARSDSPVWNENGFLLSSRGANGFILHPVKGTKNVHVYVFDSWGDEDISISDEFQPDDITAWHHYAVSCSYDLSRSRITYSLYLDGALVMTKTKVFDSGRNMGPAVGNLYVGQDDPGDDSSTAGRYGSAGIDEVRVWNRALSAAEISANYNHKLTGSESGLLLDLDMEHAAGSQVADGSAGHHDGVLSGALQQAGGPALADGPEVQAVSEDTTADVRLGYVDDTDAGDSVLTVSLTATHGKLSLPDGMDGLTVKSGANGSKLLEVTGAIADLNNALQHAVYEPDSDYNGADSVVAAVTDTGNGGRGDVKSASLSLPLLIAPVNDAPVFVKGADQQVLIDAPAQTVAGWATAISAGPADESGQTVHFAVTSDRPDLFAQQPAVDADGTLRFAPKAGVSGIASVTVALQDDGGTAGGGTDTSPGQTFTILILPRIETTLSGVALNGTAFSTLEGHNRLTVTGSVYEGIAGQTVRLAYTIFNAQGGTVTSATYALTADGTEQPFSGSFTVTPDLFANGLYSLQVTAQVRDNAPLGSQPQPFTVFTGQPQLSFALTTADGKPYASGEWTRQNVTASVYAEDASVRIAVSVDGGSLLPPETRSEVTVSQEGRHTLRYESADALGNRGSSQIAVNIDRTAPVVTLNGLPSMTLTVGDAYAEQGAAAADNVGLDGPVTVTGTVNARQPGTYAVHYRARDLAGNEAEADRTVTVQAAAPTDDDSSPGSDGQTPGTDPGTGAGTGSGTDTAPGSASNADADPVKPGGAAASGQFAVSPGQPSEWDLEGVVRIVIPQGAVQEDGSVRVAVVPAGQTPPAGGLTALSKTLELTSTTGHRFAKPVELTLHYEPSSIGAGERPAVYYYSDASQRWVYVGGTANSDGTVTVRVNHFTRFAVMAYRPLVLADLNGHWAAPYVGRLIGMKAVDGYPDGTFHPQELVTRAQFTRMLVQALGLQAANGDTGFADDRSIPSWVRADVNAALQAGLIHGYEADGKPAFGGDRTVTRAEMSVMIAAALELGDASPAQGDGANFKDDTAIPSWAKPAVKTAAAHGIVSGFEDDTFRPEGAGTRAEAAAMIVKLLDALGI